MDLAVLKLVSCNFEKSLKVSRLSDKYLRFCLHAKKSQIVLKNAKTWSSLGNFCLFWAQITSKISQQFIPFKIQNFKS